MGWSSVAIVALLECDVAAVQSATLLTLAHNAQHIYIYIKLAS